MFAMSIPFIDTQSAQVAAVRPRASRAAFRRRARAFDPFSPSPSPPDLRT
jgi:hypothetical protein